MHIAELNGFPGPYMKDFWKCFNPMEMGIKFAGSKIKAVCRLALCRGEDDVVIAEGEFNGTIVAPTDNNHDKREFELFVVLDGMDKRMLDLTPEERNEFSHRGKAIKNLMKILKNEGRSDTIY